MCKFLTTIGIVFHKKVENFYICIDLAFIRVELSIWNLIKILIYVYQRKSGIIVAYYNILNRYS